MTPDPVFKVDFWEKGRDTSGVKLPPKARASPAAWLIAAMLALLGANFALGATPAGEADKTSITSWLRRGDTVFASTQQGLYRASVTERTWRKLDALAEMTPGGMFIQQDAAAPVIAYYHPWRRNTPIRGASGNLEIMSDIFVSKDGGGTWLQTSKVSGITSVYIHPTGVFLSTQANGHVFASQDFGATWKDVMGNLPAKIIFNQFIRDPLHPDKIGVLGYDPSITNELRPRGPDFYEADAGVYQWKLEYSENIFAEMERILSLESAWQYGTSDQYSVVIQPTLGNFFTPAFLDRDPDINFRYGAAPALAFQMEMEKTAYTFRKDEPKIIPVKVEFLAPEPAAKLLDKKDEAAFWLVGMVSYGNKQGFEPRFVQFQEKTGPDAKKKAGATLRDADLLTVKLSPGHPYERGIDLAKLHDFSKPGVYRFQLYHSDGWLAGWGGVFGSPVIDVTITE